MLPQDKETALNRALILWILYKMSQKMKITPHEWDDLQYDIEHFTAGEYDRVSDYLEHISTYINFDI